MLCIWWDQQGVVYYELLQLNETITRDRYRFQLMRLSRALKEKQLQHEQRYDKVILQHDNAWPHVAQAVKTYLEALKWKVLSNPLYSPDIAASNYHLFWSMTHGLSEQKFFSYKKLGWFVDSLKRCRLLSTRNSYTAKKMGKSSG